MARPAGSKNKEDKARVYKYEPRKDENGRPLRNKRGQTELMVSEYVADNTQVLYEEQEIESDEVEESYTPSYVKPQSKSQIESTPIQQSCKKYIDSIVDYGLNKKPDIFIKDCEMTLSPIFIDKLIHEVDTKDRVLALGFSPKNNMIVFYFRSDSRGRIDVDDLIEGEELVLDISEFLKTTGIEIQGEFYSEDVDSSFTGKMWGIQL